MKKIFWFLCLFPVLGMAQVTDDFSDGNFSENPSWTGDVGRYEVNTSGQLHLLSSGTDTSILLTRNSRMVNTEWSFWIKLSFNTSANNHARIYLAADTPDLVMGDAIYLQVGGQDDSVAIIKQTGMETQILYKLKTFCTSHSTNTFRLKITRDDAGTWETMIDTTGGFKYYRDGGFYDNTLLAPQWFGIYCRYTSSNAAKCWFDDIYVGPVIHDTLAPRIVSQENLSGNTIRLKFSEAIQKQYAENPSNFSLSSIGQPDTARLEQNDPGSIRLVFSGSLAYGAIDSLLVKGLPDLAANFMKDTLIPVFYYQPKAYDIVIHEIMADPDPPVGLPDAEYVELYNRTNYPLNLKDWWFRYGSYAKVFPEVTIPGNGFILVSKDTVFSHYGICIPLFTSSSSLSNEGTTLVIQDKAKHVIHAVTYDPEWHGGSFKSEGGWSLEMKDPSNPCGCADNWEPSKDFTGGTPGRQNSVLRANPDVTDPFVRGAYIMDASGLEVRFSEEMDSLTMQEPGIWTVFNHEGEIHPAVVQPVSPGFDLVNLQFSESFNHGVMYTLKTGGAMTDCSGNLVDTSITVRFAMPDEVSTLDLVINEILPDPATGGSRFVELFNRSEKIIDIQSLVISAGDGSGLAAEAIPVCNQGHLFFPGDYIALTSVPADIMSRYRPMDPGAVFEMEKFPVLPDDSGSVILARKDDLTVIDQVRYTAEMHFPLLATTEGVSLERASAELHSEDRNNWHSAAETVGFATPGYQNSHRLGFGGEGLDISLSPEIFSPDNDGFDDLLAIRIRESSPGFSVNIYIYDARGRFIKQVANQVFTGNEGLFCWDGMTHTNTRAPIGIYILLVELIRADGTVGKAKKTTVVAGRFSQ